MHIVPRQEEEKKKEPSQRHSAGQWRSEGKTGTQWSPDIIHNVDRRPLSTEGGAHLKVTGLGEGGIVHTALSPTQQRRCPLARGVARHRQ